MLETISYAATLRAKKVESLNKRKDNQGVYLLSKAPGTKYLKSLRENAKVAVVRPRIVRYWIEARLICLRKEGN